MHWYSDVKVVDGRTFARLVRPKSHALVGPLDENYWENENARINVRTSEGDDFPKPVIFHTFVISFLVLWLIDTVVLDTLFLMRVWSRKLYIQSWFLPDVLQIQSATLLLQSAHTSCPSPFHSATSLPIPSPSSATDYWPPCSLLIDPTLCPLTMLLPMQGRSKARSSFEHRFGSIHA